jgi:AmmeMemoRadiSam system protein B
MKTPLGIMKNDSELSGAMDGHYDELSHIREHSMEVQLPFAQFLSQKIEQVCISLGHPMRKGPWTSEEEAELEQARMVSGIIVKAVRETGRDVCVIASSDFTHCGLNYGLPVPTGTNAGQFARSKDIPVIEKIASFDIDGALRKKRDLGTTACGMGPIATMMMTVKELGSSEANLLDYRTSYDVSPSHSAVGYGSIAFYL